MAKRKGSSASGSRTRSKAAKGGREEREAESTERRLDKLPQEVWEKILDELQENDLFPLALSCRYFSQKQKELVARARQSRPGSGKPRLALRTTFHYWPDKGKPASADYLRFCSKEKVSRDVAGKKAHYIRCLAAFHGHLPLLQEILEPVNELDVQITDFAAEGGQLETLQWLKTQEGYRLDEFVFSNACKNGHLETSKWLRSEGCPWDWRACTFAAKGGHLEVLKWLTSGGCPWNKGACEDAARGGHLEVLKWLRSEGCPWDEATCNCAAYEKHWDVLQWAIDNGCPYEVNHMTRRALKSLGII